MERIVAALVALAALFALEATIVLGRFARLEAELRKRPPESQPPT